MNLATDGKCFGMSEKRVFTIIVLAMLLIASSFGVNMSQVFVVMERVQQLETMLTEEWNPTWYALQKPYDYVLDKVGTYYCAQNGTTGKLATTHRSTNCSEVLETITAADTSIFFKRGTYTIDSDWTLSSNMFIASDGAEIIRDQSSGTTYSLKIESLENITIRDIDFKYQNQTNGDHKGIRIKNSKNIRIENVLVHNSSAFAMQLVGNCQDIWIDKCEFRDTYNDTGHTNIGVWADGGLAPSNIWVERSYCNARSLIWIDSAAYGLCSKWHVNFNTAENVTGDVIGLYCAHQSEITGNIIVWNLVTNMMNGIDIRNATGTTVQGNTLKRYANDANTANANVGIFLGHGCQHSKVDGNTIFNTTTGIIFYGASNCSATGNVIWDCSTAGININDDGTYNSDQNSITGGHIMNCAYGIQEVSTSDWNLIVGVYVIGSTTCDISVTGANTECHASFNGTTWVT